MDAREALAIVADLTRAGVRHVVSGGWGIDALVGRQTRVHGDLDIGVDAVHLAEVIALLARRGYSIALDQSPARLALHAPGGHAVDLHPISWDGTGMGRQQGFDGEVYDYPPGEIVEGRIGGGRVRCISAALQRRFHSGGPQRERDTADLGQLDASE
ncbi:MAG TPA: hypothetical protein VMZ33_01580 [Candidatus Limnocylindrales bacterium]|nr:hypothetical protein [Candidatus Limnocylindrales bacterium]